jgi:FG-GAP-like repeat/Secretion system C-terminal sorting domain
MRCILSFIFSTCFVLNSFAQYQGKVYVPNKNVQILNSNGDTLLNPFHGGMNSFFVNPIDLNNDAKQDLVVFDYTNSKIWTFRNIGTSSKPKYLYDPEYINCFPKVIYYMLLRDYNCDNIPDLFHYGSTGVEVYSASYVNNKISFKKYKALYHPGAFGPVNVYSGSSDIPDVVDMDNDGDLDIIALHSLGTYLQYYRNMRVENGESCDSLTFIDQAGCYGSATQGFFKEWNLNSVCKTTGSSGEDALLLTDADYALLDGDTISPIGNNLKKLRHGNNTLKILDIDGDGDKDLFNGNSNFNDAQLLIRGLNNKFDAQDTSWNSQNLMDRIYCPMYPNFNTFDFDGDGKNDLMIAPHKERNFNQFSFSNKFLFYKNYGTNTVPIYHNYKDDVLFSDMIDAGTYSYPTFFDYDKDGRKDLFVAGSTPDSINLNLKGQIYYYKNLSTPGNIIFQLITKDFIDLGIKKYNGLYPHFGDIDGDTISDLIMGNNKGQLIWYKNMAAAENIVPDFVWQSDSFLNITLPNYAAPCLFDANKDGKNDLLVGGKDGKIRYYENNSGANYSLLTTDLIKLNIGGINTFGYAAPVGAIVDTFNRTQLLVGNGDGNIERLDSVNTTNAWVKLDSFYSFIAAIERAVPALIDIDKDGNNDIVVGHKLGGLLIFKQVLNNGAPLDTLEVPDGIINSENVLNQFQIYPNPCQGEINIKNISQQNSSLRFQLLNLSSSVLFDKDFFVATESKIILPTYLSDGTYFYRITTKEGSAIGKLILQKK